MRQAAPTTLAAPLPYVQPRRRRPPALAGRWILEQEGRILGAVEAQAFITSFRRLHLLISKGAGAAGWSEGLPSRALAFLVSGLMIQSRADLVVLIPLESTGEWQLQALGWGDEARLWTPWSGLEPGDWGAAPGLRLGVRQLDPHAWWLTPSGEQARANLGYLEKRQRLEEEREKAQLGLGRPRLAERLSRFLRWS